MLHSSMGRILTRLEIICFSVYLIRTVRTNPPLFSASHSTRGTVRTPQVARGISKKSPTVLQSFFLQPFFSLLFLLLGNRASDIVDSVSRTGEDLSDPCQSVTLWRTAEGPGNSSVLSPAANRTVFWPCSPALTLALDDDDCSPASAVDGVFGAAGVTACPSWWDLTAWFKYSGRTC